MYIENKYWNNYIGDTDYSLNLIAFLEEQDNNKISFSEILKKQDFRSKVKTSDKPLALQNSLILQALM